MSAERPAPRVGLYILLAAFVALGCLYAVVTPLFEASDELWHYPMVKTIADGDGLPVQDPQNVGPWRQEGSQPPLYYFVAALATAWIDTSDADEVRWLNPHVDNGVITPDGNINLAIHTFRERWPWRGTALAVRLVRFISVAMSAGTVYFTYRLAMEVMGGRPVLALGAAAVTAFTPMFLFISGAVNNDNLAGLLSAAVLWLLVRRAKPKLQNPNSKGILLGLAALTKESTLGLFPLAAAVLAYDHFRRSAPAARRSPPLTQSLFGNCSPTASSRSGSARADAGFAHFQTGSQRRSWPIGHWSLLIAHWSSVIRHWPLLIVHWLLVFGLAGLIAGWWYWRNYVLYGDFLGLNVFIEILGQRAAPASLAQLWSERAGFMQSYWGLFGGVNVPMPNWIYVALNALAALSVVGLAVHLLRCALPGSFLIRFGLEPAATPWQPLLLSMAWTAAVILSLVRWATVTWSSQGRLVFSAISAISTLFVLGLASLAPRRAHAWLVGGLAGFLFSISALAPFLWIAPRYADPPGLTPDQLAGIQQRIDADFGGEMRLLGYDLDRQALRPGESLTLTLYWQSQIAMDRDWSVFVHLLDENDIVVAQRDTYPGLGLMPTRKWAPGQTLADRYVVRLSDTAYAPAQARLQVGLYDFVTGERLRLLSGADTLTLAPIAISPNAGPTPNPLAINFGDQIELAGYDLDRRVAAPGETLHLTLYWRGLRRMTVNYSVFAHVRGEGESLWAQMDSWPQRGAAPTSLWVPGSGVIEDRYDLTLKPDTPPDVYSVEVGLYDSATGERLQIITPGGRWADNFVTLSPVRVAAP